MKKDKILIVGTGALATLFAAKLSSVGVDVSMLGSWVEGIDALNKNGVKLILPDNDEIIGLVKATRSCEKVHYAIILVKSWQTERIAHQLKKCLTEDGIVLTL